MARFEKGHKSIGGRPRGEVIEKIRWDVKKLCEANGFNPFEKLIDLAMNSSKEQIQLDASSELATYLAPKMKQISLKNEDGTPFRINLVLAPNNKVDNGSEPA